MASLRDQIKAIIDFRTPTPDSDFFALIGPYSLTGAETTVGTTPTTFVYPPGSSLRNGVDQTGLVDATSALQTWGTEAFSMFGFADTQGLWNGGGGASPIITLAPGKYKVSGPTVLPTGCTVTGQAHPANTTSHTRLIMNSTATSPPNGAGDNRNKAIFKFSRATVLGGGGSANAYLNMTIQNLEFWYVTLGNNFANPLSGAGIAFGDYPLGGSLFFDIDIVDTRIVSCCFQHSPCAIRIKDVSGATTRGDGLAAASTPAVNIFIEECEFDAGAAHIYATSSVLDLTFKNCSFYGGLHKYVGCTGKVVYENCRFYGNSFIDASDNTNSFSVFRINGGMFDQCTTNPSIYVANANLLDIKNVSFQSASGTSTIVANTCNCGTIGNNSFNDSGFNGGSGTGTSATAAILMIDCQNMAVSGNNITATDAATYAGFGIITTTNVRTSQFNFVSDNAVTAPYNGATFNGQDRFINLAAGDIRGVNYNQHDGAVSSVNALWAKKALSQIASALTYGVTIAVDVSQGNKFDIAVTNGVAFTISNPTNTIAGSAQRITIIVYNFSGGVMGAITWGGNYKMSAWTNPANNFNRAIDFEFDGTATWRQVSQTGVDIPN